MSIFDNATERPMTFIPLMVPGEVFEFMEEEAAKKGVTVAALINDIFFNSLKKMQKERGSKDGH